MKHLASLINRSLLKAYIIWTLCFGLLATAFVFYGKEKQKIQMIQDQLYTLSQIDKEMSLSYVLYRDTQRTLDKLPPFFAGWLESRNRLLTIMPDMEITLRNLEKSGKSLYALLQAIPTNARPPAPAQLNDAYLAFRKQADSLEVPLYNFIRQPSRAELQVMGINYWSKSLYYSLERGGLVFLSILWFLGLFILMWSSMGAIRRIRLQSEEVLGILWAKLKNQSQESEELSFFQPEEPTPNFDFEAMKENAYHLFEASRSLSQKLAILSDRVHKTKPDPNIHDNVQATSNPKINHKEKLNYMQKLLARLFTRAERTASLAKAVGSNGFQAGILALNVSIEAARAGENGRPFLSVSDKVKDFGEKSSRISEAILEEIKDADVVIRRAYTSIKEIIETTPLDEPTEDTPKKNYNEEVQEWVIALESIEEILKSASYVQQMAQTLETKCLHLVDYSHMGDQEHSPSEEIIETREAILQSFEKLYFFNYGDTPPSHVFRS
ncbi:MAG: methyl-accepting chemotaxis protein [Brevinema sp.]